MGRPVSFEPSSLMWKTAPLLLHEPLMLLVPPFSYIYLGVY